MRLYALFLLLLPLLSSAAPPVELAQIDAELKEIYDRQADVFAREEYVAARRSFQEARKELRAPKPDRKKALEFLARAGVQAKEARRLTEMRSRLLPDLQEVRARALAVGAWEHQGTPMVRVDKKLAAFSAKLNSPSTKVDNKKRQRLLENYLDLELETIKAASLGFTRGIIAHAREQGARKLAPQTLALVEKKYADTEAFITANREKKRDIMFLQDDLDLHAERLLEILRAAKEAKGQSPEQIALRNEASEKREAALGVALVATEMQREEMSEDLALGQLYAKARALLGAQEAEVSQQDNSLVIRLKDMHFASGQSSLAERDKTLLEKVRQVVRSAGPGTVTVEGHTDALGSGARNRRLSEARAESVVEYFSAAGMEGGPEIAAKGMGDTRPLASNKTAEGRAQNRRVDVVILPAKI